MFNILDNSYALSLIVTNQVPSLKFCMYFSFPVDPPICLSLMALLGKSQMAERNFSLAAFRTAFGLTVQQLQTTKERLIPLQYRNSRRPNSSKLAVDPPVRYDNSVLLTGPWVAAKQKTAGRRKQCIFRDCFYYGAASGHTELPDFISDHVYYVQNGSGAQTVP